MIMSGYSCITVLAKRKNPGGKPDGEIWRWCSGGGCDGDGDGGGGGASLSRVGARIYAARECVSYGLSFSSGLRVSALK